jgi:hypothetical protein
MRVYELARPGEHRPYAFEIPEWRRPFWRKTLVRFLESVPEVTEVRRGGNWFSGDENRAHFLFHGVPFVVWEPWGDNSRYWIGPADTKAAAPDLGPLMQAFREY